MAGFEDSKSCVLYAGDGATSETFTILAGQSDTSLSLSANRISTSNKSSGVWGTSLAGRRDFSVSARGFAEWPDTAGIAAIRAKIDGSDPDPNHNKRIVMNQAGEHYQYTGQTTQFEITAPDGAATGYNLTSVLAQGTPAYAATLP